VNGSRGPRHGEMKKRVSREVAEKILSVEPDLRWLGDRIPFPAMGTHRRIQALVAIGWTLAEIGRRIGVHPTNVTRLVAGDQVWASTARAVSALYEELWNTRPPAETKQEKISRSRALNMAVARRWLPPMAWDDIDADPEPPVAESEGGVDEMAVELALMGEQVRLSPEERRAAVRVGHGRRWSDGLTAERLHCHERTVLRIRDELGLPAFDQSELVDRSAA
jgi:AraC-like DNA-binding protein